MSINEALKLVGVVGVNPSAICEEPIAGRTVMRGG
jgi:hypothetical protein